MTPYKLGFSCDICHKQFTNQRILRCNQCEFDVCADCRPVQYYPSLHSHTLSFSVPAYSQCSCSICGKTFNSDLILRCNQCSFDVCENCRPHQFIPELHPHSLAFSIPSSPIFSCNICGKSQKSVEVLCCERCNYNVCNLCKPKFLVKSSHPNTSILFIEQLKLPTSFFKYVSPRRYFENRFLVRSSLSKPLVSFGHHTVAAGFYEAFCTHRPVLISPDIFWLLICQGFSRHVNQNAEQLRSMCVNFDGKKTLSVARNCENISDYPFESVFPDFSAQIAAFTGEELKNVISADFSTSTPTSLIATQITFMDSMKKYFNYRMDMCVCGIPSVYLEGTFEDWVHLQQKLSKISQYCPKNWIQELSKIISQIIETKQGNLDLEFWRNMIRVRTLKISDGNGCVPSRGFHLKSYIDGWILNFYPYNHKGKARRMNSLLKDIGKLPSEIVTTPFKLFDTGSSIEYDSALSAGFFGMEEDPVTHCLKPEIGWAVQVDTQKTGASFELSFDSEISVSNIQTVAKSNNILPQ